MFQHRAGFLRAIRFMPLLVIATIGSELQAASGLGVEPTSMRKVRQKPADNPQTLASRIEAQNVGQELFLRDWSTQPKASDGSDGLGPMFNDVSCAACHFQAGIGGGGTAEKNVRLLHVVGANGANLKAGLSSTERSVKSLGRVHPDLSPITTTVVLHRRERHGNETDENRSRIENGYRMWMAKRLPRTYRDGSGLLPLESVDFGIASLPFTESVFRSEGVSVRVTERNTTALFGAGLIDQIPDSRIIAIAERQKKQNAPLITGRVPQTSSGAIGRFGWRGQIGSLREFVFTACAVELGLTVPGHNQSEAVILRVAKSQASTTGLAMGGPLRQEAPRGLHQDLTTAQCDALTTFVAEIPAPSQSRAPTLGHAKSVQRGEQLFEKIGCAVCHVPDVGPASGIYSDLLLHDMGPNLSDPAPAMPEIQEQLSPIPSGYFGVSVQLVKNVTTNIHQEWRTPPLWGVAHSAPYLHDGRAHSLQQAIEMHGGEGRRAAEEFRSLKPNEKGDFITFLTSLIAPGTDMHGRRQLVPGGQGGGGFF